MNINKADIEDINMTTKFNERTIAYITKNLDRGKTLVDSDELSQDSLDQFIDFINRNYGICASSDRLIISFVDRTLSIGWSSKSVYVSICETDRLMIDKFTPRIAEFEIIDEKGFQALFK